MSDQSVEPIYPNLKVTHPSEIPTNPVPKVPVLRIPLLPILLICLITLATSCNESVNIPPQEFPLYPDAQVLSRTGPDDRTGRQPYVIILSTIGKPEAVRAYYVDKFRQIGWALYQEAPGNSWQMFPPLHQVTSESDQLFFTGGSCSSYPYEGYLITTPQNDTTTSIEIEFWFGACH